MAPVPPSDRRSFLSDLHAIGVSDVVTAWRNSKGKPSFRERITSVFVEVADRLHHTAADTAADWYDQSAPDLDYTAEPAPPPEPEALERSADWALGGDGEEALDRMSGTLQRTIANGARNTTALNADFEPGARWVREAAEDACEFCRLMAIRGAVYRTELSALRVVGRSTNISNADRRAAAAGQMTRDEAIQRAMQRNAISDEQAKEFGLPRGAVIGATRGNQSIGDKYHDNCHCTAIEIRPGMTYTPPAYVDDWNRQYEKAVDGAEDRSLKAVLKAWRALGVDSPQTSPPPAGGER